MRDNYSSTVVGKQLQLVPYREKFVQCYHKWMQSPFLLEMTGSEPLTIEEEYEMQKSWRDDQNKCTFILITKDDQDLDEIERMIGDVNLFLSRDDNDLPQAEIDIMVAEEKYRRKGMGIEAVCLMMWYGVTYLGIQKFFAKIKKENDSSLNLFKKLGYEYVNYVEAFHEYEYQLLVDFAKMNELISSYVGEIKLEEYNN